MGGRGGDHQFAARIADALLSAEEDDGLEIAEEYDQPPNANFDTLDDVPYDVRTPKDLDNLLQTPLKGAVGVVLGGAAVLSDPSSAYWGKAMRLQTGEYLQLRVCPRGRMEVPLGDSEWRMIAVRRSGPGIVTDVSVAMVFLPRTCITGMERLSLTTARTTGCRGLHLLLPSLWQKHNATRDHNTPAAATDVDGFHCVLPCSVTISKGMRSKLVESTAVSVCPGPSYAVIAAHMAGVDEPDPLTRPIEWMTEGQHTKLLTSKTKKLLSAKGEARSAAYMSSALTVTELLSAEGIVSMLCNTYFEDVLPDMIHSPLGMVLLIVMATRMACYPQRFGLMPVGTPQDNYACAELACLVNSQWEPVVKKKNYRAIDVIIRSGIDNARAHAGKDVALGRCMNEQMQFWQRVGQRVVTKLFAQEPSGVNCDTFLGNADLVEDPISDAKYAYLSDAGLAQPLREAPINRVTMADNADVRATLLRMYDSVEYWLSTGLYARVRISNANVNVSKRPEGSSSSGSDEDGDDVIEKKLCLDAVESGASMLSVAMLHGASVMHQLGMRCHLVGEGCTSKCADCDAEVSPVQGMLFGCTFSACAHCGRRRCFACITKATNNGRTLQCKRCAPGTKKAN
jgi:hypothetical protein